MNINVATFSMVVILVSQNLICQNQEGYNIKDFFIHSMADLIEVQSRKDSIFAEIHFRIKESDLDRIEAEKLVWLDLRYDFPSELIYAANNLERLEIGRSVKGELNCERLPSKLKSFLLLGSKPKYKLNNINKIGINCPNLVEIILNKAFSDYIEEIISLNSLRWVYLDGLDLDVLSDLSKNIQLESLSLINCKKLELVQTTAFNDLKMLSLKGTEIDRNTLRDIFPKIECLYFANDNLNDPLLFNDNRRLRILLLGGVSMESLDLDVPTLDVLNFRGVKSGYVYLRNIDKYFYLELNQSKIQKLNMTDEAANSLRYLIYDVHTTFFSLEGRVFWNLNGFTIGKNSNFLYDPKKIQEIVTFRTRDSEYYKEIFPNLSNIEVQSPPLLEDRFILRYLDKESASYFDRFMTKALVY